MDELLDKQIETSKFYYRLHIHRQSIRLKDWLSYLNADTPTKRQTDRKIYKTNRQTHKLIVGEIKDIDKHMNKI